MTCRVQVLPTSVRTGVSAASRVASCGSSAAVMPARRVDPNAASLAWVNFSFFASAKKVMSRGFEPGKPPSM